MADFGMEIGETCNREGCQGKIIEGDGPKEGCSCHIAPPCHYCTTPREVCDTCDWQAVDDMVMEVSTIYLPYGGVERKPRVLNRSKIDYRIEAHSGSSQKCIGVFPIGTTASEVKKRVDGTFGGRFEKFNEKTGDFIFIAYTD